MSLFYKLASLLGEQQALAVKYSQSIEDEPIPLMFLVHCAAQYQLFVKKTFKPSREDKIVRVDVKLLSTDQRLVTLTEVGGV